MEMSAGGHRGRGAAVPVISPSAGRCRRFKPRELDGFVFASLQDELVVDDVYLRVLVLDAEKQRALGGDGDVRKAAAAKSGLGQGLALPMDLLVRKREINQAVVVDNHIAGVAHIQHLEYGCMLYRLRKRAACLTVEGFMCRLALVGCVCVRVCVFFRVWCGC